MRSIAKKPASEMTMAMTMASRGRLMKVQEITASPPAGRGTRCGLGAGIGGAGRNLHIRPDALLSLQHHLLAASQAPGDHRRLRGGLAELNAAALHPVVGADHVDEVAL